MLHPRKVLVVEDAKPWQNLFKETLFPPPTQIEIDDGSEYKELLSSGNPPDLVLIDFDLGRDDVNGRTVLEDVLSTVPESCIGLISAVRSGGYSAHDAARASFFLDKNDFLHLEDVSRSVGFEWTNFMRDRCAPHVQDDWSPLETVIMHRPSSAVAELGIDPQHAARTHDALASVIRGLGVRVLELRELLIDTLSVVAVGERPQLLSRVLFEDPRQRLLWERFVQSGNGQMPGLVSELLHQSLSAEPEEIAVWLLEGRLSTDWPTYETLFPEVPVQLLEALPYSSLLRDAAAVIEDSFITCSLAPRARRREGRLLELIFTEHPWLRGNEIQSFSECCRDDSEAPVGLWRGPDLARTNGRDILPLQPGVLAVGYGAATDFAGATALAQRLTKKGSPYEELIVVRLPDDGSGCRLGQALRPVGPRRVLQLGDAESLPCRHFYRADSGAARGGEGGNFLDYLKQQGFELVPIPDRSKVEPLLGRRHSAIEGLVVSENMLLVQGTSRNEEVDVLGPAGIDVVQLDNGELQASGWNSYGMVVPVRRQRDSGSQ